MFSRLGRIRRGEYPLGVTYWGYWLLGNGLILGAFVLLFAIALAGDHRPGGMLLAEFAVGAVLLILVYPVYAFSTSIGALRSAGRYLREGHASWSRNALGRLAQIHAATGFLAPFLVLLATVLLFLPPAHPH